MKTSARVLESVATGVAGGALGFGFGFLLGGPIGAVLASALAGANGLVAGGCGIYDWRRAVGWLAFAADSTWGLVMTSLGVILSGGNALAAAARHDSPLSFRRNRHVFEGGLALQPRMALTLGNVTSNGNPSGRGLNPVFLDRHEGLHVWQARAFGPLFPLVYLVWGSVGTAVGVLVWLFHSDQSLAELVQTAAYFDNPFEYWAYRNDENWPPSGAHPLLAWPGRHRPD